MDGRGFFLYVSDREGENMSSSMKEAMALRRSIYAIGKNVGVSDEHIRMLVEDAVRNAPSAFNCQSARLVLLFGGAHDRLWDIVKDTLSLHVPAGRFASTEKKLAGFKAGYGTVLFFDDAEVTRKLMDTYPSYKDHFPLWAQQANGMLQYAVWTLLEAEGLGASLQHYNPLIDGKVLSAWGLPETWQLIAQMPFGSVEAEAGSKESIPVAERMKVFSD